MSLEILVLAKPVKTRLFPHRKPRFITLVIDQNTSLAALRSEIEATNLQLDRIVVRPGPTPEGDKAELVLPPRMQAHPGGRTQGGSSLRREKFSAVSRNHPTVFGPETRSVSLEPTLASHRSIPKQKAAASEAATKEAVQPKAALRDASRWLTAMTAPLKKAQKAVMMSSPKYVSDSVGAMAASSVGTLGTMTMYGSLFTIAVVRALLPSRSRSARG